MNNSFIVKLTLLIVAIGLAAIALGYGKSLQQRMLKALNSAIKGGILHDAAFSISYVNIFTVHNRLIHYFNQLSSRLFFRNARCDFACASADSSLIISSVIASYARNSIGLNFLFTVQVCLYGKQLIVVSPKNTSHICSCCGKKNHQFDELATNQWLSTRK